MENGAGLVAQRQRMPKGLGYQRRKRILDAAEAIFLADGYERATIRRIAEAAGISSTSLYVYFADKGELLLEIASKSISELLIRNKEHSQQASGPRARIEAMLGSYMSFAFSHPHAYQLVFGQPLPLSDERLVDVRALGAECFALFELAFEELAEDGQLRGEPMIAAQVAWGAAHGVASLVINHPAFDWAAGPQHLSKATIDYILNGII